MRTIRLNQIILLLFLLPGIAFAHGIKKGKYTREKKISKAFAVNSTAGLTVSNKYGNIYITTWDEDKTAIDVVITVNGNDEDDVVKRINGIDVDFNATTALVGAKTIIENSRGRNINMEINYTIKIPKRGTLGLANQYGGIKLGVINGGVNINCQYGSLDIESLNSENNNIILQYCDNSKLGYIKGGTINAQYSGVNISRADKITAKCEYTGLKIGDAKSITYRAEYGDVTIGTAETVTGAGDYLNVRVNTVESQINLSGDYSNFKFGLANTVKNTVVNGDYTNTDIKYNAGYAFNFEFDLEYGNVKGMNGFQFTEKRVKDFNSYYKGYYKSNGGNKIFFSSDYGNLTLIQQ